MNLQVNLLDESEVRNTSRVSRKFLIQGGVVLVLLFLLGWVTSLLWKQASLSRQLKGLQAEYEDMKPKQERVNALLEKLNWHQSVMDELTGWQEASINWHEELSALTHVVPANMQFVSMEISGPLRVTRDADKPAVFNRKYGMDLVGIAQGEASDETVLHFIRDLPNTEHLQDHWESATLQRIQNQVSNPGSEKNTGGRRFELAVTFKDRSW